MDDDETGDPAGNGLKICFNPFLFTIEENNAMLAKGWEVMPLRIPDDLKGRSDGRP